MSPSGAPALTCPSCGATVAWDDVAAGPCSCQSCGAGVTLKPGYFRVLGFASLLVAAIVLFAFGLRGNALFAWTALAWFPIRLAIELVNLRLFPPDLELSGEFRRILHPPGQRQDLPTIDLESIKDVPEGLTGAPSGSDFLRRADHATLEGVVIWAGAASLVLWFVWNAASPLLRHMLPMFRSEMHGPQGFPVTLRIEDESLGITNGSPQHWTCDLAVGIAPVYHASVSLAPGSSQYLLFVHFRGTDGFLDATTGRSKAYERIHVACREPSGRSHYSRF